GDRGGGPGGRPQCTRAGGGGEGGGGEADRAAGGGRSAQRWAQPDRARRGAQPGRAVVAHHSGVAGRPSAVESSRTPVRWADGARVRRRDLLLAGTGAVVLRDRAGGPVSTARGGVAVRELRLGGHPGGG